MIGGKRKLSKWNKFVQKIYAEQRRKNKNFQFKDALKMASAKKKKGQYGGEGEQIEENYNFAEKMTNEGEQTGEPVAEEYAAEEEIAKFEGGRRRRRTRRRRHGSRRARKTHRRRSRSHRGGQIYL